MVLDFPSLSSFYPVSMDVPVHIYGQTLAAAAVSATPMANYDDLKLCMYWFSPSDV